MTGSYRLRTVLTLFLVLHLTACYTWLGVATTSPAQLIEATQPDYVRVLKPDGTQVELANPSVEGDQLVGTTTTRTGGRFEPSDDSISLEDILQLELRSFSLLRSIGAGFGMFWGVIILVVGATGGIDG
ncbi:MAG: hypothetical protein ABGY10_06465 [bacterium]|jgi:hypothetical protein|nr:hypothetical protein [Gemmatimonadota bacterium]HIL89976.1 hypothetical protein [Gemmatimonadota bacterium]